MWFSATFRCPGEACGIKWTELIKRSEREGIQLPCPACETPSSETIGAPMVMQESYLDGQRRKSDGNFQKLKEATQLERKAMNMPPDKRGDLNREIRKLRSTDG